MNDIGKHTGLIYILIFIGFVKKTGLYISLGIVTETGIAHIHHQNTNISIIKLVITTIITVMFCIIHLIYLL